MEILTEVIRPICCSLHYCVGEGKPKGLLENGIPPLGHRIRLLCWPPRVCGTEEAQLTTEVLRVLVEVGTGCWWYPIPIPVEARWDLAPLVHKWPIRFLTAALPAWPLPLQDGKSLENTETLSAKTVLNCFLLPLLKCSSSWHTPEGNESRRSMASLHKRSSIEGPTEN